MIVEVKDIPVRHNGKRYSNGEQFEIDSKAYDRIKAHVNVIDESDIVEKTLDEMTVPELKAYAVNNNIDLGEATKKEDILKVLQGDKE